MQTSHMNKPLTLYVLVSINFFPPQKKKQLRLSKEQINKTVESAGLDQVSSKIVFGRCWSPQTHRGISLCIKESYVVFLQLPSRISDSEVSRLASMFSTNSLEKVALRFFRISEAEVSNARADNLQNSEGFNRALLHAFKNKGHNRKVFQNEK